MIQQEDSLRRFIFENKGIRGEWVNLTHSWRDAKEFQTTSGQPLELLGEALAAVVMLSATIKFKGSIILQAQGQGPVSTLVAQATDQRKIRGVIRSDSEPQAASLSDLFGDGYMAITIESQNQNPYQGIVPLIGANLAEAIESYFVQSEQLSTRIWLSANEECVGGLFLQELPNENFDQSDWEHVTMLANTITDQELLELDCETLLHRLFSQERIRLLHSETVAFQCNCSRNKIESTLISIGKDELETILDEQGLIAVDCQFCGRGYVYKRKDIEILFPSDSPQDLNGTKH